MWTLLVLMWVGCGGPDKPDPCASGFVDEDIDCDGVDDDCDPDVGADARQRYAVDRDADGFGSTTDLGPAVCGAAPPGFAEDATDCDDVDPHAFPGATEACDGRDQDCDGEADNGVTAAFWADLDGDGFGDPASTVADCAAPAGYVDNDLDCDDAAATRSPDAAETCDGADNDCDGAIDEEVTSTFWADLDGDGFGDADAPIEACAAPADHADNALDCDDAASDDHPDAAESCDGRDNDCDGSVDEEVLSTFYADLDGDGFGDADAPETACAASADHVADASDCDDTTALVSPGGAEACDGLDNDCDAAVDEGVLSIFYVDSDADGYGDALHSTSGCAAPLGYVADATDCDDADAARSPGLPEVCDGLDDDCDLDVDDDDASLSGAPTWYGDGDRDGYGSSAYVEEACNPSLNYVALGTDCDDADPDVNPGEAETCNGYDEDCDGLIDDQDTLASGGRTAYLDADLDGFGAGASFVTCRVDAGEASNDDDCDDANAGANPDADEVCDPVDTDEDCDGLADEDDPDLSDGTLLYPDADNDGYGVTAGGVTHCDAPPYQSTVSGDCDDAAAIINPGAAELCDPLDVDEDCDGAADDLDPEGPSGAALWYTDSDGDGYGDDNTVLYACDAPVDTVAVGGDCGVDDPDRYPGAPETCGDGIYNDCDGPPGCALPSTVDLPTSSYVGSFLSGDTNDDRFGAALSFVGDLDGRSGDEVLVGAPTTDAGVSGAVYLFSGADVAAGDLDAANAASTIIAFAQESGYGVSAGDVDGDDRAELVVASNFEGVRVYTVDASLVISTWYSVYDTTVGPDHGGGAGVRAWLTDLDGDLAVDLLVADNAIDSTAGADSGAAYVLWGPIAGGSGEVYDVADADALTGGLQSRTGASYPAGDMDGDGTNDVLITAWGDAGAVYLVLGGARTAGVLASEADASWTGNGAGDHFGFTAVALDADLDGYPELFAAAGGADAGGADSGAIYEFGGAGALGCQPCSAGAPAARWTGLNAGDALGRVARAGDVDGDGQEDLVVSAEGEDTGGSEAGAAWLVVTGGLPGGAWGIDDVAAATFYGDDRDALGPLPDTPGDADGDDRSDLLFGAPQDGTGGPGLVYFVSGAAY